MLPFVKLFPCYRLLALENDETTNDDVRTFPEHPRAPQLGKNEMLAQHNAQHKISLRSSTASLLLILKLLVNSLMSIQSFSVW
jgi:hypothetical protein